MHPCLKVPELLSIIFGFAYNDAEGQDHISSSTMLASALTCRLFVEPALDLLWEVQSDIVQLLRCFPSEIYEYEFYGGDTKQFVRPLFPWLL